MTCQGHIPGLFQSVRTKVVLAVAHGRARMHGSSDGALDVAVVSQVCSLLLHNGNMSNCRQKNGRQMCDIESFGRRAAIRMGSGGI
eukprot:3309404-Amphidinium_carterae.1